MRIEANATITNLYGGGNTPFRDMEDLTNFDKKPEAMVNYLRYNGSHFSKALCEFAYSLMPKKAEMMTLEEVDIVLARNGVSVESQLYDRVYVANLCKNKFCKSVSDEKHLAYFIKEMCDDLVFNRWYADCCKSGIVINWEKVL